MRLGIGFAIAVLCAAGVMAEGPAASKVIMLSPNLEGQEQEVVSLLSAFPVKITFSSRLHGLAVSGSPEAVKAVEEVVRRLDVPTPRKAIELTAHLISATRESGPTELPADLESVAKQLRGLGYQGCKVIDSIPLRTLERGDVSTSGSMATWKYSIDLREIKIVEQSPRSFRIQRLTFRQWIVGSTSEASSTGLEIREGQKVVVGRTKEGADSVFLVLTARVAE